MIKLKPQLDLLGNEYLLVQAWKKTASYIRYHNWFSDTLELDKVAVNLPNFINELQSRLSSAENWQNDPLRIILAPKSQRWILDNQEWKPENDDDDKVTVRPLAHVKLTDQVIGTALMLCLADRVETIQGDPRERISNLTSRKKIISYGNRLFCDKKNEKLYHRWGSAKLYRAYYQDFRNFLDRSESIVKSQNDENKYCVIHADIKQFYDRVSPSLFTSSLAYIKRKNDDPAFYTLVESVFNWQWDYQDADEISNYATKSHIEDFSRIALPQGLVSSGFFANLVLLPFEQKLKESIGSQIVSGIQLIDVCRYVDDFRILIEFNPSVQNKDLLEGKVTTWINKLLKKHAPGLELSEHKTKSIIFGEDKTPLIRQSEKMNRIQTAISGGFDSLGGEDILDAIQGLMQSQVSLEKEKNNEWHLTPVPDVRDETVIRFSAGRYRSTYRSLRPLLYEDEADENKIEPNIEKNGGLQRFRRTQQDLDQDARVFAYGLIKRWIDDPSNIRLLRIGLDIWPDMNLLEEVLLLLRPLIYNSQADKSPQSVAWYCMSEILRAGAVETGLVTDSETFPSELCLDSYRNKLKEEALKLVNLTETAIPWYLRQQALLFLIAYQPNEKVELQKTELENRFYLKLLNFLQGEKFSNKDKDFATLAVISRRSFLDKDGALSLIGPMLNRKRKIQIAKLAPSFFLEIKANDKDPQFFNKPPPLIREDLCLFEDTQKKLLSVFILRNRPNNPLRNELSLLIFAKCFLEKWKETKSRPKVITPGMVELVFEDDQTNGIKIVKELKINNIKSNLSGSMFEVPNWCKSGMEWRYQLGFLLRFILSQNPDFTANVRQPSWKEAIKSYRSAESHWYQRLYGLYSGQSAFGDDWAPISEWVELFLLALLRWPGCRESKEFNWVERGIDKAISEINSRKSRIEKRRGKATSLLVLPLSIQYPTELSEDRPLRACMVQTVIPNYNEENPNKMDLTYDGKVNRRKHRNHLSAALAAVERVLDLRETHKNRNARLDWLILPELAVHPKDVKTHLIPFARAHRAIILAGLTYQEIITQDPLVNSALWVIPEWSTSNGLQIRIRRQGKKHLAPIEQEFNDSGTKDLVKGFRPCQWLIGYPWSVDNHRPIWLTATVCYDATDLGLATDLRNQSDILAIPALNQDVRTFDQMALALHYHMFQAVIVVNNGTYGGSNAYWPKTKPYERKIFHTHGQPQTSISFFEIDNIRQFLDRKNMQNGNSNNNPWKFPPAGL